MQTIFLFAKRLLNTCVGLVYPMTDRLFLLPVRVYYQDTDAGGVVYHATYLNFMERARYEWLRECGNNVHELLKTHKLQFMVRWLEIEYLRPAILDDLLHISVAVSDMGRCHITLAQEILCNRSTLVKATLQVVCVGTDSLKPVRIPVNLKETIEKPV